MISLCIITKGNEELDNLKRAVKSCVEYVDEVCITATSDFTDETEKWCKKNKYNYSHFRWNQNFADARNFNYAQAKYNQFFIDSDDVVINPEGLKELDQIIEDGTDWILLPYLYAKDQLGRVVARQTKPRLTRKDTGKWVKSVHECFEPIKAITHKTSDLVVIDHVVGENHDEINSKRNLGILLDEYRKDKEKTDPRTLMYIGNTLMPMNKFEEALSFFTTYLKVSGSAEDKYFVYHNMTTCFFMLKEYESMINCALQMLKINPEWSLGYFDLARGYSLTKEYKKVIDWTLTGLQKDRPDTLNFTNDNEFVLLPMGRLADAYLMTGMYEDALDTASRLKKAYPDDLSVKELYKTCKEVLIKERFVKSFVYCADMIRREDRLKAISLFECLPSVLQEDSRIQNMQFEIVPPKNWSEKSIVIYCGRGIGENWAYPSIFTGIGGSEEMVIRMSQELTKKGYEVTVYNNCGELQGNYDGVEYKPFFFFNPKDNFHTLISWRIPAVFDREIRAKKKIVWLHDLAYDWQFNDKIIKNTDKFIFLSKFHRSNMPSIPDEKIFISNNGIVPEDFIEKKEKRPHSLVWTSSYDRGLLPFMKNIFPLIKKAIPDVTLDVAYGWNNIDRELDVLPAEIKQLRIELPPLLEQEGVKDHGRLSHKEVADLYKISMCMPYASEFGETNNISSQKAQASGCYVITTPQAGATPEYLEFGEVIRGKGIYEDKEQQQRFADAVVRYLKAPKTPPSGLHDVFSVKKTAESWKEGLL